MGQGGIKAMPSHPIILGLYQTLLLGGSEQHVVQPEAACGGAVNAHTNTHPPTHTCARISLHLGSRGSCCTSWLKLEIAEAKSCRA